MITPDLGYMWAKCVRNLREKTTCSYDGPLEIYSLLVSSPPYSAVQSKAKLRERSRQANKACENVTRPSFARAATHESLGTLANYQVMDTSFTTQNCPKFDRYAREPSASPFWPIFLNLRLF